MTTPLSSAQESSGLPRPHCRSPSGVCPRQPCCNCETADTRGVSKETRFFLEKLQPRRKLPEGRARLPGAHPGLWLTSGWCRRLSERAPGGRQDHSSTYFPREPL
eukprot:bmy_06116T0